MTGSQYSACNRCLDEQFRTRAHVCAFLIYLFTFDQGDIPHGWQVAIDIAVVRGEETAGASSAQVIETSATIWAPLHLSLPRTWR